MSNLGTMLGVVTLVQPDHFLSVQRTEFQDYYTGCNGYFE